MLENKITKKPHAKLDQTPKDSFCQWGYQTVEIELNAIKRLLKFSINEKFSLACKLIMNGQGKIIVTGMGKSGHIGRKLAATFTSTGNPAIFLHPAEASHGDLGMMTPYDIVLALSHSGYTEEVLLMMPLIKKLNIKLITITGNPQSPLARTAHVNLDASIDCEACPLNLAPTASTTATLVLGDALAMTLAKVQGFSKQDFALRHPAGHLGRRLLLLVKDLMHQGKAIPKVIDGVSIQQAIIEMSRKKLGMTAIVNDHDQLLGIFTDGDLRRTLEKGIDIKNTPVNDVMTQHCKTVTAETLAMTAFQLMEQYRIFPLLVIDTHQHVIGALNMHDLFRAGITQ